MESLFRDLQKFLFFFERVAELFIQQRKNNPDGAKNFFRFLFSPGCRLRLSWRFLTVIVRTAFSTGGSKPGTAIIDELLLNINCNRPTQELNVNAKKFTGDFVTIGRQCCIRVRSSFAYAGRIVIDFHPSS